MLHRLGSNWLHHYPVTIDSLSTKSSCGHSQSGLKPTLVPVGGPSAQTDSPSSPSPTSLSSADSGIDPHMEDDSGSNNDSDYLDEDIGECDFDD